VPYPVFKPVSSPGYEITAPKFRFGREKLLAAGVSFNVFAGAKYSKGYKLVCEHKRLQLLVFELINCGLAKAELLRLEQPRRSSCLRPVEWLKGSLSQAGAIRRNFSQTAKKSFK
jgi:hypothetical protein